MENVTVSKEELLKIVRENKEKYDAAYKESIEGYWETARKKVAELSDKVAQRQAVPFNFRLDPVPDHSQDYESAIRMLELSVDEKIELPRHEFDALVLNRWPWRDQFVAAASTYEGTPKAALRRF